MNVCELEISNNSIAIEGTFKETEIDKLNIEKIDYNSFFSKYMLQNVPCILENVTSFWGSNEKWIFTDKINHDYFISNYGENIAPVADCNTINLNSQCKTEMKVKEFMYYLKQPNRDKLLYLKDWHLQKTSPTDNFYHVPFIFGADWLNEYAIDKEKDDFMFVYIGPANSWTPLHVDVYHSFSWSVNVIGKKKWILFPPKEEEKLQDTFGNLPLLFEHEKYPNIQYFEIIQKKGDALFVPSGWHHQVLNIEDTISINHNWMNACNLELVWESLQKTLMDVEKEIVDIRDSPEYYDQCQIILKSIYGMDLIDFINLLAHIADKRLTQLDGNNHLMFGQYKLGNNHVKFDLKVIIKVFDCILQHPLILNKHIELNTEYDLSKMVSKIKSVL